MAKLKTFFRYPGGKSRLSKAIIKEITKRYDIDGIKKYVEPFVGGGGMLLPMLELKDFDEVIINDSDCGIFAVWNTILYGRVQSLVDKIAKFTPTVEAYNEYKEDVSEGKTLLLHSEVELAFRKIALHQMSFSGLGPMSGSPIGGLSQNGKYKIDCRWNASTIGNKIMDIADFHKEHYLSRGKGIDLWMNSAEQLVYYLKQAGYGYGEDTLAYMDPPYYTVGNKLYRDGMSPFAHERLSKQLRDAPFKWALSYDNCTEIRELYSWADIVELDAIYTLTNSGKSKELLIFPKQ